MDIKIPTGPKENQAIEAVEDAKDAIEETVSAEPAKAVSPVALDVVSKIAEQVALGEIGRQQAIDQLLADVLGSKMVKAAPSEAGQELSEILKALLDTDPHLKSLASVLGLPKND